MPIIFMHAWIFIIGFVVREGSRRVGCLSDRNMNPTPAFDIVWDKEDHMIVRLWLGFCINELLIFMDVC